MILTGYELEFSTTLSLGLINLLEWFTGLRKIFYLLYYQFIIKRMYLRNSQIEVMHRVKSGRVPSTGVSVPLDIGDCQHVYVYQPGSFLNLSFGGLFCLFFFFWRRHDLGTVD